MSGGRIHCPKDRSHIEDASFDSDGTTWDALAITNRALTDTELFPGLIGTPPIRYKFPDSSSTPECLAAIIAHERLHVAIGPAWDAVGFSHSVLMPPPRDVFDSYETMNDRASNERYVRKSVAPCFHCDAVGNAAHPLGPLSGAM